MAQYVEDVELRLFGSESASASISLSSSVSPSVSRSSSVSPSLSQSSSVSHSISQSRSASSSPSHSVSSSPSSSVSRSISPSIPPIQYVEDVELRLTVSASRSISPSASISPSQSVSKSASGSASRSVSKSISPSISGSTSLSPSPSAEFLVDDVILEWESPSLSPSASASGSISISISPSASISPSRSVSPSISPSRSNSPSSSVSHSVSSSISSSSSASHSVSPSISPSRSVSSSVSHSISPSKSVSPSISPSISPSKSLSPSSSASPSASVSPSPSQEPSIATSARAYVLLKDQTGKKVAVFDDFQALSFTKTVNDVGSYSLSINGKDARRLEFELDGQVEVWRSIPGVIDWYKEFEGLHRKPDKKLNDNGSNQFVSNGVGYNELLARRVVAYKSGTIRAAKNCSAETAIKQYVDENCAKDLMTVVGRLSDGYMPGFYIEADKTSITTDPIPNWSGDKAFENLLDVLKEIATSSGIDFNVVGTGPAQFTFYTYLKGMGLNKTYHTISSSGRNEYGNIPVVFSAVFGSMSSATYSDDRIGEANVVIVQGDGEGSTKHTVTRSDPNAMDDSPWNIREVSRSASIPSNEVDRLLVTHYMEVTGDETLKELARKERIVDCVPLQTPSSLYGVHYQLGDTVTVWFDDVKMDKRITSVTLEYSNDGESVSMELSDIP